MWAYKWVHTIAQIELITLDCPIIVYPKGKDKNGKEFTKANADSVYNAADKWENKYKGSSGGVKVSLEGLRMMGNNSKKD